MIYTNKTHTYIVADTLEELHKFCKSIGLKKSEFFHEPTNWRTERQKAYYTVPSKAIVAKMLSKKPKVVDARKLVVLSNNLPGTDMYEAKIQKCLYNLFITHNYKLNNTIIFNWESDFFCKSDSGHFIEVEIKISRSDFLVDFKKQKHKLFEAQRKGKKILVHPWSIDQKGDTICTYTAPEINSQYGPYGRMSYAGPLYDRNTDNWEYDIHKGKPGYWVNDWGRTTVFSVPKKIISKCTRIEYIVLEKHNIPNQFYFAVPHGLVEKTEIPEYAGLIYIKKGEAKIIKRAPYLHKRSLDLTRILLTKFYNLWTYKQSIDDRIEITEMFNQDNKKTEINHAS